MTDALIRAVICGAVDDGKSTLLGRLLAETGSAPLDELEAATSEGVVDYSLLTDGLASEREQGITIDVAYRHVELADGRRVIMADSPGHEQYTRNMAVAASLADVAVLVIDAVRGLRTQSFRHVAICARMGVSHLVIAVTKIDALDDAAERFVQLQKDAEDRFASHGFARIDWIPTSGVRGDNLTSHSAATPWYSGPTLLDSLARTSDASEPGSAETLRVPIQTVVRTSGQRWYGARIAHGLLEAGATVRVARTATTAVIAEVRRGAEALESAPASTSVTIRLDTEIDLARGDILVPAADPAQPERVWLCDLVWLDSEPLEQTRSYLIRSGPSESPARIDHVRSVVDIDTGVERGASSLAMNDLGRVELVLDRALLLDPYTQSRHTGGVILVDRASGRTVAAGMIVQAIARESEVTRHAFAVGRAHREQLSGVRAVVVWLTGLSGSGKSTIADEVERRLVERGIHSITLDGDAVRATLSDDLGFSPEDRRENVRRVSRVAELLLDSGLVVLVSLVSPFRRDRELAYERFAGDDLIEVFVDTPLSVCEARDPKGLYAKARAAGGGQMTGLGQSYEEPESPTLRLDGTQPLEASVAAILDLIIGRRLP